MVEHLGAVKHAKDAAPHAFYNPFWAVLRDQGVGTLAYKGAWNLFDQIVVSGNLLKENSGQLDLQYFKNVVHNHDFLIDTNGTRKGYPLRTFSGGAWLDGYSDHFPTEVFLKQAVMPKR